MTEIFQLILKMSIAFLPIMGLFCLIRFLAGKRLPPSFHYALWVILLFRLLIPIEIPTPGFFLSEINTTAQAAVFGDVFTVQTPSVEVSSPSIISSEPTSEEDVRNETETNTDIQPITQKQVTFMDIAVWVWAIGTFVFLLYHVVAYLHLRKRILRTGANVDPHSAFVPSGVLKTQHFRIKCCSNFDVPFVVGVIHPIVVLPLSLFKENEKEAIPMILRHEMTHIRRQDVLVLYLSLFIRCVYWFHPLVYLLSHFMKMDQEAACDASVIRKFSRAETQSYANVLLSVASSSVSKVSLAVSEFGQNNLKRRIQIIMKKKVYTKLAWIMAGGIMVIAVAAILILSSAKANASTTTFADSLTAASSISPVGTGLTEMTDSAKETYSITVKDNNVLLDKTFTGNPYSLITVTNSQGQSADIRYDGTFMTQYSTGDINGDGNEEIALYMEYVGSTGYGLGAVHVLSFDENTLSEFPRLLLPNENITDAYPDNFETDNFCGGEILDTNEHTVLRLSRQLFDSTEDAVQYIDTTFTDDGWAVSEVGMSVGIATGSSVYSVQSEVTHREGFKEAELTFVTEAEGMVADDINDPDVPYNYTYMDNGIEKSLEMPSLRESAQLALQQLYDITGYQGDSCYVLCSASTLFFSTNAEDFNFGSFYSYNIDPSHMWNLSITYKGDGVDSPITASTVVSPPKADTMAEEEIAKWYYDISSFGDRSAVVSTEKDGGFIRLYLESGKFYEVSLSPDSHVILSIVGPYNVDVEH